MNKSFRSHHNDAGNGPCIDPGLFREGVKLFDRGDFWEAHEAWEEIWKAAPGPERLFVQGLIHVAAAFHQWRRGRLVGAGEHFRRASGKLAGFPSRLMGIDLDALRGRLGPWREQAEAGGPFPDPPRLGDGGNT